MRRKLESIFLTVLMVFSLMFAACGKKEEQQDAPPPPPPASTAPQPSGPSEQAAPATGDQNAPPSQPSPGEPSGPEKKDDAAKTK